MKPAPIFATALLLLTSACASGGPVGNPAPPPPAKAVDLTRYLGRYYEMARYENSFEQGCEGDTAEYATRPDGLTSVVNTCRKGAVNGPVQVARGRARRTGDALNAKLQVSFFGPFFGDYWVMDHADDYGWSIVGEPSGRYLWILTRTAVPPDAERAALVQRARDMGYDTSLLRFTKQPPV